MFLDILINMVSSFPRHHTGGPLSGRLSMTAYSMYLQIPSISGGLLLYP